MTLTVLWLEDGSSIASHHFKLGVFLALTRLQSREGNGTPLQYSCLANPMDRGAWWAAVYGVAQSRPRLKRLSSSCRLQTPGVGDGQGGLACCDPWGRKELDMTE